MTSAATSIEQLPRTIPLTRAEILDAIPQRDPFRFVDTIESIDEDRVVSTVRFDEDAWFYKGHFPGNPVTPGVILLEAMAQGGLVPHALYLFSRSLPRDDLALMVPMFVRTEADFLRVVRPGEWLRITGTKRFFRRGVLCSDVELNDGGGNCVARGVLRGMGVRR